MKRFNRMLVYFIAAIVALLAIWPMTAGAQIQIGTYSSANVYAYETIVDINGEYKGQLPDNVNGEIFGVTVFRFEPNNTWYPVVLNTPYDNDNIVENIGWKGRSFGGYFKHNEHNWTPIQEHIGKRLRIVIFVR